MNRIAQVRSGVATSLDSSWQRTTGRCEWASSTTLRSSRPGFGYLLTHTFEVRHHFRVDGRGLDEVQRVGRSAVRLVWRHRRVNFACWRLDQVPARRAARTTGRGRTAQPDADALPNRTRTHCPTGCDPARWTPGPRTWPGRLKTEGRRSHDHRDLLGTGRWRSPAARARVACGDRAGRGSAAFLGPDPGGPKPRSRPLGRWRCSGVFGFPGFPISGAERR